MAKYTKKYNMNSQIIESRNYSIFNINQNIEFQLKEENNESNRIHMINC